MALKPGYDLSAICLLILFKLAALRSSPHLPTGKATESPGCPVLVSLLLGQARTVL
ncbi:hypothetical protein HEQ45_01490 [Lactobacillus sp. ZJLC29-4]|nr:hypothetical protein [Lactobacillus sp. HBUAS51387]